MGPQYTSCVAPQDYKGYQIGPELGIGIPALLVAIATGNPIALATGIGAVLSGFHEIVRYMLYGKLICLHGEDRCVIGTVANIEEVGQDKFLIEQIDNDYSINLVLQPFDIEAYLGTGDAANQEKARSGPQGGLLKAQAGIPLDDKGDPKYGGYFSTWIRNDHTGDFHVYEGPGGEFDPDELNEWVKEYPEVFEKNYSYGIYRLPVIHCECEGSRIRDVLDALESYPGGKSDFCKKNWFTKLLCKVVATAFAPYVFAKVIYAWATASGGSSDDARLDPRSGEIRVGDTLLVRGRWVYDAAHSGYNEIHAVKTIQKLRRKEDGIQIPPAEFGAACDRWCKLACMPPLIPIGTKILYIPPGDTSDFPDPPPPPPPVKPQGMTPEQEQLFDRQRMPENRWFFHPALDACEAVGGKP